MSLIKRGHTKEAGKARRSNGASWSLVCASPAEQSAAIARATPPSSYNSNRQQVHKKLVAGYRASEQYCDKRQKRELRFGKRVAHNVRLLSIVSLIVISMLSRECTARAFLGLGAGGNTIQQDAGSDIRAAEYYNNADKQQQQQVLVEPVELDYALELGCKKLVESILFPQQVQPKDQKAAMDFVEFIDNERIKRLSPKHTPRFGR